MINSNLRYLNGIREGNRSILREIYDDSFPLVANHIKKKGGNQEDAKDVFQEAMITLYEKVNSDGFELKSSFSGYLFGVCRNVWSEKFKKRQKIPLRNEDVSTHIGIAAPEDEGNERMAREELFIKQFDRLDEKCQKVLRMYLQKVTMKKIAEIMDFKSDNVAMQIAYRCRERLTKWIRTDPAFVEL